MKIQTIAKSMMVAGVAAGLSLAGPALARGTQAKSASIDPQEVEQVLGSDVQVGSLNDLSEDDIRSLQQELQARGLYHGQVDGIVGPLTRNALSRHVGQQEELNGKLLSQGKISSSLLESLGTSASEIQPVVGAEEAPQPEQPPQQQMQPAEPQQQPAEQQQAPQSETPQRKGFIQDLTDEPGGVTQGDREGLWDRITGEPGGLTQ